METKSINILENCLYTQILPKKENQELKIEAKKEEEANKKKTKIIKLIEQARNKLSEINTIDGLIEAMGGVKEAIKAKGELNSALEKKLQEAEQKLQELKSIEEKITNLKMGVNYLLNSINNARLIKEKGSSQSIVFVNYWKEN